jgi:anti-sigma-K factor RskA
VQLSILDAAHFRATIDRSVAFRNLVVRQEQALIAQLQQSVACNASHPVEARLSRRLLRARELSGNECLPMTSGIPDAHDWRAA